MADTEQGSPEWNLNSYKINFIGQKMVYSLEAFEKSHYIKSFNSFKMVRLILSNRLTSDENKKCKIYEKVIPKQTLRDEYGRTRVNWKYVEYLEWYIEYVQLLIKKHGLDLSEKSESSMF